MIIWSFRLVLPLSWLSVRTWANDHQGPATKEIVDLSLGHLLGQLLQFRHGNRLVDYQLKHFYGYPL